MKTPYPAAELDDLIKACIEFSEIDTEFSTDNIAGRAGVEPDQDYVRARLKWIARLDADIVEEIGYGFNNIYYYRLGPSARQLMKDGGFGAYFRRAKRAEAREEWLRWLPVAAALAALLISAAAWLYPRGNAGDIDGLRSALDTLKTEQESLRTEQERLKANQGRLEAEQKQVKAGAPGAPQN